MRKFKEDDVVVPVLIWTEANYERAVAVSDDEMPETFALWQENLASIKRSIPPGAIVIEIEADPDEVAEWCRVNGCDVTTKNRARWTLERFRRDYGV